jgi:hypothetical protein
MKIAQRAKVKLSMDDYKKRSKEKTKAGNEMSRMAHMELAIRDGIAVNLGDVIFYVNNGLKASHGDVQKVNDKMTKKEKEEYKAIHGKDPVLGSHIQLNCYRLNQSELESNPDMLGDYNVARAVVTFNKRIEPLLIVFGEEVRNNLIVDNPEERGIFTKEQCKLINGVPFEPADQDSIDDLLTITDQEKIYWEKRGIDPEYIYELAEQGWEELV